MAFRVYSDRTTCKGIVESHVGILQARYTLETRAYQVRSRYGCSDDQRYSIVRIVFEILLLNGTPTLIAYLVRNKTTRESIKTLEHRYAKTGVGSGALDIEIEFVTADTAAIVLHIVRTPITLTVKLSDILINAMIRVEFMSVGGSLPCFDALGISMVRNPRIDFSLDALGGDLTCLPGLEGMINSTIKSILAEMLVWPHRMVFPTKAGVDVKSLAQSGGKQGVDAVCILRCTVIEASSLETFGNEDFLEKIENP